MNHCIYYFFWHLSFYLILFKYWYKGRKFNQNNKFLLNCFISYAKEKDQLIYTKYVRPHVRCKYVNNINSITIIFALCSVSFNKQNLTSLDNREDTKFTFFLKAVLRVIRLHCNKLFKLDEYHACYRHLKAHFVAALSSRTLFIWKRTVILVWKERWHYIVQSWWKVEFSSNTTKKGTLRLKSVRCLQRAYKTLPCIPTRTDVYIWVHKNIFKVFNNDAFNVTGYFADTHYIPIKRSFLFIIFLTFWEHRVLHLLDAIRNNLRSFSRILYHKHLTIEFPTLIIQSIQFHWKKVAFNQTTRINRGHEKGVEIAKSAWVSKNFEE